MSNCCEKDFAAGVLGEVVSTVQTTVANVAAAAISTSGNSTSYSVAGAEYLMVGVNVTAGSGSIAFTLQGLGPDGNWYTINTITGMNPTFTLSGAGNTIWTFGPEYSGLFPNTVRLVYTVGSGSLTFGYWLVQQSA